MRKNNPDDAEIMEECACVSPAAILFYSQYFLKTGKNYGHYHCQKEAAIQPERARTGW
jgi:hypothetical protein